MTELRECNSAQSLIPEKDDEGINTLTLPADERTLIALWYLFTQDTYRSIARKLVNSLISITFHWYSYKIESI